MILAFLFSAALWAAESTEVKIPGNSLLEEFEMDAQQVTRSQYLRFVREYPEWQQSRAIAIYADSSYLKGWSSPEKPNAPLSAPVTEISWFAAKAFCEWQGKSLPTIAQWELVGSADETSRDAIQSSAFRQRILKWYSKPGSESIPPVRSGYKNVYGVWDLHGLVWEWTEDFNSVIVDPESCGASGNSAKADKTDYANFMRNAFRSSLKANSTVKNLGFRCVRNRRAE